MNLADSILSGNQARTDADIFAQTVNSNGHNIFGSTVAASRRGDLGRLPAEPLFVGGIADNGGPTETIALASDAANPALGRGAASSLDTDQRGEPRPAPGQTLPDIGAFELQTRPSTLLGDASDEVLRGTARGEILLGRAGDDRLLGLGQGDRFEGGRGDDVLIGGPDGDLLLGGLGADRFRFEARGHSRAGAEDLILDFARAQGDRIDLRAFDAKPDRAGNQELEFVGTRRFAEAGETRFDRSEGYTGVEVNLDRDDGAELSFRLDRATWLREGDFLL